MGIPGSANPMLFGGAAAYQINQSLRFNSADSARLYRTLAASQTRTYSFWYKYANLSGGNMYLFHHKNSGDTNYLGVRSGGSPSENQWQTLNQGSSYTEIASSRKYRDPSAWQHVLWKCTSANVTMYVNGVEFASTGGANTSLSGGTLEIGARGSAEYFGGYIAEFHFVDGTAYNPSDFGETDAITGAWIPKRFSGTYGSNGAYLKFDPSATNGIGHDHSGNGNNFTATGFSTSGTGTDVMSDTPTNNWCTLNPIDKTDGGFGLKPDALSDGNLVDSSAYNSLSKGTIGVTSGKWYFEFTGWDSTSHKVGVALVPPTSSPLSNTDLKLLNYNGQYQSNAPTGTAGGTTYGGSISSTDIVGVAIDMDNRTIAWAVNGQYGDGSGNWDETYANASKINLESTGGVTPCCLNGSSTGTARTFNFGQRAFAYTPPTGFKALNTANLPEPTIKKGSKYFDTVLYTGNGSTQTISGLNFSPDFVWFKSRNTTYHHALVDAVRGVDKYLYSSLTIAEETQTTAVSSFNSNGFSFAGNFGNVNNSGTTYAAWAWDANGAGSSNTAGTITSTVSANATAGFSIATYTGNGTAGATVGHGLGVAPKMIMVKRRDTGADWAVYHASTGATKYLTLNNTNSAGTSSAYWNNTEPTSTLFSLGLSSEANTNAATFVAYCFSEVAGYSKFGSYVGNGSTDGPFVFCGFRPRWVLTKRTDSTSAWYIHDTARNTYNVCNNALSPDLADAEVTANNNVDILSNGFKLKTTGAWMNASGGTYIFAAFSETAFKYSNAR